MLELKQTKPFFFLSHSSMYSYLLGKLRGVALLGALDRPVGGFSCMKYAMGYLARAEVSCSLALNRARCCGSRFGYADVPNSTPTDRGLGLFLRI